MKELYSAGLLMYELQDGELRIFLVHPGGPFFRKKDEGYWSIPKGLIEDGEDHLSAAIREFEEETGIKPEGEFVPLGKVKQKSGKMVKAWAFRFNLKTLPEIKSNNFEMEWPPKSGKMNSFPEIDRGEFFDIKTAAVKMNSAQIQFIDELKKYLSNKI
jgi:predicted NUDIX family NTP pyrophosphohydrolase